MLRFLWLLPEYCLMIKNKIYEQIYTNYPSKWNSGTKGNVILIPGWNETWFVLKTIGDELNNSGYKVHVISELKDNKLSVLETLKTVESYIEEIKTKEIILVCHSKGGIVARLLLSKPTTASKISKVFFVSATIQGTWLGYLPFINIKDQTPKSVQELPLPNSQIHKIINLYPLLDNIVIPNKNLLLDGAENIQIPVIGHTRILNSSKTIQEIISHL
jgi:hypothetical protein